MFVLSSLVRMEEAFSGSGSLDTRWHVIWPVPVHRKQVMKKRLKALSAASASKQRGCREKTQKRCRVWATVTHPPRASPIGHITPPGRRALLLHRLTDWEQILTTANLGNQPGQQGQGGMATVLRVPCAPAQGLEHNSAVSQPGLNLLLVV